jgi:hypothetical protein
VAGVNNVGGGAHQNQCEKTTDAEDDEVFTRREEIFSRFHRCDSRVKFVACISEMVILFMTRMEGRRMGVSFFHPKMYFMRCLA